MLFKQRSTARTKSFECLTTFAGNNSIDYRDVEKQMNQWNFTQMQQHTAKNVERQNEYGLNIIEKSGFLN